MRPDQGHKLAGVEDLQRILIAVPRDQLQILASQIAHRDHHAAAFGKLIEQNPGRPRGSRRYDNDVIGGGGSMPLAAITAATCLCAAFGSILMGALANYPLALAMIGSASGYLYWRFKREGWL